MPSPGRCSVVCGAVSHVGTATVVERKGAVLALRAERRWQRVERTRRSEELLRTRLPQPLAIRVQPQTNASTAAYSVPPASCAMSFLAVLRAGGWTGAQAKSAYAAVDIFPANMCAAAVGWTVVNVCLVLPMTPRVRCTHLDPTVN